MGRAPSLLISERTANYTFALYIVSSTKWCWRTVILFCARMTTSILFATQKGFQHLTLIRGTGRCIFVKTTYLTQRSSCILEPVKTSVRTPLLQTPLCPFRELFGVLLTEYKWKTCLFFLDDIIIYSNAIKEHKAYVNDILCGLKPIDMMLMINKRKFFTMEVEYLGYISKPGKLEIDWANAASLRKVLPRTNTLELCSILGMCNVYRRFVDNLAHKAGSLHYLLQKHSPEYLSFNKLQLQTFQKLIYIIPSPPTLSLSMP